MTDPVQVVAEGWESASCDHQMLFGGVPPCLACRCQSVVAALEAAGALMPVEMLTWTQHAEQAVVVAQQERDEARESSRAWLVELEKSTALLQEALSVLGPLLTVPYGAFDAYQAGPEGVGEAAHNRACDALNAYKAIQDRAASLAEKIEKATGGEG